MAISELAPWSRNCYSNRMDISSNWSRMSWPICSLVSRMAQRTKRSFGIGSTTILNNEKVASRNNVRQPFRSWWARLELNQRCFSCHGFTDRCARQLRVLTHMAESAELESDTMRCDPLSGRSPDLLGSLSKYGWGGWIRTNKCWCQRPVP